MFHFVRVVQAAKVNVLSTKDDFPMQVTKSGGVWIHMLIPSATGARPRVCVCAKMPPRAVSPMLVHDRQSAGMRA